VYGLRTEKAAKAQQRAVEPQMKIITSFVILSLKCVLEKITNNHLKIKERRDMAVSR
jgi:hypothetical protein